MVVNKHKTKVKKMRSKTDDLSPDVGGRGRNIS